MTYRFTHMSGTNRDQVDMVENMPITLGRDDRCQVRFDKFKELGVSGHHATIAEVSEGAWTIENLSKNGLMVNGVPCDGSMKLPNHATIQLGKDGPRIRFDVDQSMGGGISKADVQKRKEQTKKRSKASEERGKAPITEERPVFQVPDVQGAEPTGSKTLLILGVAVLLAIAAVVGAYFILAK